MARQRCTLWHNPLPLGWGDHVRWMHELDDWRRAAGPRHSEARRGAAAMRSAAYAALPVAWRLDRGAHAVERYTGIPSRTRPIVDREYGRVEGMVRIAGYLVPER